MKQREWLTVFFEGPELLAGGLARASDKASMNFFAGVASVTEEECCRGRVGDSVENEGRSVPSGV